MAEPARSTVYVVDNDVATANFVRNLAERMDLVCEIFSSGLEFLDAFDPSKPCCLVLAVRIADISGPQIQRRLLTMGIEMPLVFVTGHATVSVVVQVMRDGALSVLEKPLVEQELWDAIQEAVRVGVEWRAERGYQARLQAKLATVTRREHDVFALLLAGKTNREIAKALNISIRTVELRRSRLLKKLEARSLVELIRIGLITGNGTSSWDGHAPESTGRGGGEHTEVPTALLSNRLGWRGDGRGK